MSNPPPLVRKDLLLAVASRNADAEVALLQALDEPAPLVRSGVARLEPLEPPHLQPVDDPDGPPLVPVDEGVDDLGHALPARNSSQRNCFRVPDCFRNFREQSSENSGSDRDS